MERYVALAVEEPGCWTVHFPDFPGTETMGFPLYVALWKAKRMIGARAAILNSLGQEMPKAKGVSEIVSEPGYKDALPYIIAIRRSRKDEGESVYRFG
jgi:predicted RNase H-like HicB family nuclease